MNDNNTFLVRNASLQAQPFGTPIYMNALSYFYSFYGQDIWRIRPSLTLTYGLNYSWQTPYTLANQEEAFLINASSGQLLSPLAYIQTKAADAAQGVIYNPTLGFLPIAQSNRSSIYNTDYGDRGATRLGSLGIRRSITAFSEVSSERRKLFFAAASGSPIAGLTAKTALSPQA